MTPIEITLVCFATIVSIGSAHMSPDKSLVAIAIVTVIGLAAYFQSIKAEKEEEEEEEQVDKTPKDHVKWFATTVAWTQGIVAIQQHAQRTSPAAVELIQQLMKGVKEESWRWRLYVLDYCLNHSATHMDMWGNVDRDALKKLARETLCAAIVRRRGSDDDAVILSLWSTLTLKMWDWDMDATVFSLALNKAATLRQSFIQKVESSLHHITSTQHAAVLDKWLKQQLADYSNLYVDIKHGLRPDGKPCCRNHTPRPDEKPCCIAPFDVNSSPPIVSDRQVVGHFPNLKQERKDDS